MPENQIPASAEAGSATVPGAITTGGGAGETATTDYKALYEELQTKLGSQGNELGEYRQFFQGISPLLDKLDENPELVQAIIDGKVNSDLVKAALEGKVTIVDAASVSQAHEAVKKELGKDKYEKTDPAEIEKMVAEKVEGVRKELSQKLDETEELRVFEKNLTDFIASKTDFSDYADGITKWFKDHPDQDNIEVAYDAVKGQVLSQLAADEVAKAAGEAAKNVAANASGGSSQGTALPDTKNIVDTLIAPQSNPNLF